MSDDDERFVAELSFMVEELCPSDYRSACLRDRPYDGQPHTDTGERGRTALKGITFRDVRDCFIIGLFHASGLPEERWGSVYELDLNSIDILAAAQNMSCELERRMGIYPNVPHLEADR